MNDRETLIAELHALDTEMLLASRAALRARVKALEEALGFYADPENLNAFLGTTFGGGGDDVPYLEPEVSSRARAALGLGEETE